MKTNSPFSRKVTYILWAFYLFSSVIARSEDYKDEAQRIMNATGVKGGLIVHIGCGDGKLTTALRVSDMYLVQGLDTNPRNVQKAREYIQSFGIYVNVSVDVFDGKHLPYVDNLLNLIVAEDDSDVSIPEMIRTLAPKGVAYVKRRNGTKEKIIKPYPKDMDEWTHYLHDSGGNAVAADTHIGPPKHIRWMAGPLWSRSHEFNPSLNALVSGGGRMFYIYDEGIMGLPDLRFPARWVLYARDTFNGKLL